MKNTEAEVEFSTDKSKLDIKLIHKFLTNSYWAEGRTIEAVKTVSDLFMPVTGTILEVNEALNNKPEFEARFKVVEVQKKKPSFNFKLYS